MVQPPMAPGSPGPYGAVPPPPPEKSNRTLFIVLGVVAAVLFLCCCGGGVIWLVLQNRDDSGDSPSSASPTAAPTSSLNTYIPVDPDESESAAVTNGKVGTPIRQGDLEITVTAAPRCGVKQVGSGYRTDQAEGQFCLIDLRIRNLGTKAIKPASYGVELIDQAGGETTRDYLASWYANPGETSAEYDKLFQTIYPNKTVTGIIAFDIPVDQKPDKLVMNPSGDFNTPDIVIDLKA